MPFTPIIPGQSSITVASGSDGSLPAARGVKVGGDSIREMKGSPKFSFQQDKATCVRIYFGPMTSLLNVVPEVGTESPDQLLAGFAVESVDGPEADADGMATMTVNYVREGGRYDYGDGTPRPVYEVNWSVVQKDITQHKIFRTLTYLDFGLVESFLQAVKTDSSDWKANKDAAEIRMSNEGTNKALMNKLIYKKLRGQTSFTIYSPVVTMTTKSTFSQSATGCGFIEKPPADSGAPSGYQYMKTGDRVTKQKGALSERVQEWTGADYIDEEIYDGQRDTWTPVD